MRLPTSWRIPSGLAACLAVAGVIVGAVPAFAEEMVNTNGSNAVAIHGYDPVAYFVESRPTKGDPAHAYTWRDAEWRFASAEHKDLFIAAPEKYAPQFGGYCALGVAQGARADIDPEAWTIVDGRLYLNYSQDARAEWLQDVESNIQLAREKWPAEPPTN